jgi:hypothetical protein
MSMNFISNTQSQKSTHIHIYVHIYTYTYIHVCTCDADALLLTEALMVEVRHHIHEYELHFINNTQSQKSTHIHMAFTSEKAFWRQLTHNFHEKQLNEHFIIYTCRWPSLLRESPTNFGLPLPSASS